ncbi:hypothetical protein J3T99_07400 [Acetobacteraceae bacterium B3987]|nr:hypothetical protein [Acetobacteraceae bacterium B3987]
MEASSGVACCGWEEYEMRKLLLTAAAMFGLAGTAWAEDEFVTFMKARGEYHEVMSKEQAQMLQDEENDESLVTLRRAGLTPDTAQKAVWALNHKPQSSCAIKAGDIVNLTQMARAAPDNPATAYSPDTDVILIERNHLCDRNMLDR